MKTCVETIVCVLFVVVIEEVSVELVTLLVLLLGWATAVCSTVADAHEELVVPLIFKFILHSLLLN